MEFMTNLQEGFDPLKPSLFELLSEQQLSSLLPPSIRYLLALATHRHPRYLLRILNSFDEVYALLMLLVERHYLKTYGGSFTENFYGLKRERVLRVKGGEIPRAQLGAAGLVRETLKLQNADIWKNLAVMVGIPYLKRKLDEGYDVHIPQATLLGGPSYINRDALPSNPTIKQRLMFYYKWFLRHVYPSVNAAYYFSILAFNLAYLFDNSRYNNPLLWLIGIRMRRLGAADHRAIAEALQPRAGSSGSGTRPGEGLTSMFHPRVFARTILPRLLSSLRFLLPTSIFALKFLEWWHASDFARQLSRKATENIELPPPVIAGYNSKSAQAGIKSHSPSSSTTTASVGEKQPGSTQGHPDHPSLHLSTSTRPNARKSSPPIDSHSLLPIFTVPALSPSSSSLCPICLDTIQTPTAAQTGYVYCYACIHKWVAGIHERQEAFMEGGSGAVGGGVSEGGRRVYASHPGVDEGYDEQITSPWAEGDGEEEQEDEDSGSRIGSWESGKGRCAVTGRRVLGGTDGLRRVMI